MEQPESTPNESPETEQPREITTREDFAAYMEAKRNGQSADPPEDDEPQEPEAEDQDGESAGDPPGEGEEAPEGESEGQGEQQLGIDGEGDFKRAGKPPEGGADLSSLPEEVRQAVQQQIHQAEQYANSVYQNYTALQGRLAPVQRQNEDLRRENEQLKAQLRDGGASQSNVSLEDLEKNDAWKEVSQEFPDEAKELRKHFEGKESALQQATQQTQQLREELDRVRNERTQTEMGRLKAKHPDADEIRQHPQFHMWMQQIVNDPQADQELVRKMSSPFYEDAADVLSAFKRQVGLQPPQEAPAPAQQTPHQQPVAQSGDPNAPAREGTPPPPQTGQPSQSPRQAPPPPSPPSQGAGMSGASRSQGPLSQREAFRQEMKRRQRLRNQQQR